MMARSVGIYVISVVAEIVDVHPQTIRHYERLGLIAPARTETNRRRFTEADLATLQHIQELVKEGCNLTSIKRILELEAALAATQQGNTAQGSPEDHDSTFTA